MPGALGSLSLIAVHVLFRARRHGDTPCQRPAERCIALNDQEGRRRSRVDKGGLDERFFSSLCQALPLVGVSSFFGDDRLWRLCSEGNKVLRFR